MYITLKCHHQKILDSTYIPINIYYLLYHRILGLKMFNAKLPLHDTHNLQFEVINTLVHRTLTVA